jgi:hypothetical protein
MWLLVLMLVGSAGGIAKTVAERSNHDYYGVSAQFAEFQRGFWPVFGICLLAVAIGRTGRFAARGDVGSRSGKPQTGNSLLQDPSIRPCRFQFSLFRLLMATAVCAVVFGLSRMYFGRVPTTYYWFSGMIALALVGMVLVVRKEHFARVAMSVELGVFGAIAGFFLKRLFFAPSTRLEMIEDDLYVVVPFVVVFWIIGCLLSRWDERIGRTRGR